MPQGFRQNLRKQISIVFYTKIIFIFFIFEIFYITCLNNAQVFFILLFY